MSAEEAARELRIAQGLVVVAGALCGWWGMPCKGFGDLADAVAQVEQLDRVLG